MNRVIRRVSYSALATGLLAVGMLAPLGRAFSMPASRLGVDEGERSVGAGPALDLGALDLERVRARKV